MHPSIFMEVVRMQLSFDLYVKDGGISTLSLQ